MSEEYITRPEFEIFCRSQNGSLQRIENSLDAINKKLDTMVQSINDRVTWEAFEKHKNDCKEEIETMKGRLPVWTTIILTFLTSATVAMLTLVLSRAL